MKSRRTRHAQQSDHFRAMEAERAAVEAARAKRCKDFLDRIPKVLRGDAVIASTASCLAIGIDFSDEYKSWLNEYISDLVFDAECSA